MLPFPLIATRPRVLSLVLVAAVCATEHRIVMAQPAEPSATLEVTATSDCTSRADLLARVRARSPRATFVDDSGRIAIRADFSMATSGTVTGDITLGGPGSNPSARRVLARTCAEAADAAALIIAITLDPSAARPTERDASARADETTGDRNEPSPDASRAMNRPKPSASNTLASTNTDDPSEALGSPQARWFTGPAHFAIDVAFQTFAGPAPELLPGFGLYGLAGIDGSTLGSPAVVLGVSRVWRAFDEPGGTASFQLTGASLDACPFCFRLGRFEGRPCASMLGGRLAVKGTSTRNPASESRRPFWVVGGAALLTARIAWDLEASARAAVGANLVRDSFEFTPAVFHGVPPVTVAVSLGLGLRLH